MSLYLTCAYGSEAEAEWFRGAFAAAGKKLDMGKSCVRFKKLEDLPLAPAERIAGQLILRQIGLDHRSRHARTQVHAAAADLMNRLKEMLGGLPLGHASFHAGAQRLQHVMFVGVHGQQDHLGSR